MSRLIYRNRRERINSNARHPLSPFPLYSQITQKQKKPAVKDDAQRDVFVY
jgi:hypothetical protein